MGEPLTLKIAVLFEGENLKKVDPIIKQLEKEGWLVGIKNRNKENDILVSEQLIFVRDF